MIASAAVRRKPLQRAQDRASIQQNCAADATSAGTGARAFAHDIESRPMFAGGSNASNRARVTLRFVQAAKVRRAPP